MSELNTIISPSREPYILNSTETCSACGKAVAAGGMDTTTEVEPPQLTPASDLWQAHVVGSPNESSAGVVTAAGVAQWRRAAAAARARIGSLLVSMKVVVLRVGMLGAGTAAVFGCHGSSDCSESCSTACISQCECANQVLTLSGCFNMCTSDDNCGSAESCRDGLCGVVVADAGMPFDAAADATGDAGSDGTLTEGGEESDANPDGP
jgi:hypothetical protein